MIVQIDKARHPGDVANARCLFDSADDAGFIDSNAGVIPDSVWSAAVAAGEGEGGIILLSILFS